MRRMKEETGVKNLGSWKADGQVVTNLAGDIPRVPKLLLGMLPNLIYTAEPSRASGAGTIKYFWKQMKEGGKNKGYRMKAFAQRQLELQILASLFLMERQLSISFHDQCPKERGNLCTKMKGKRHSRGWRSVLNTGKKRTITRSMLRLSSCLLPTASNKRHLDSHPLGELFEASFCGGNE